jgi:hypothetical protein
VAGWAHWVSGFAFNLEGHERGGCGTPQGQPPDSIHTVGKHDHGDITLGGY